MKPGQGKGIQWYCTARLLKWLLALETASTAVAIQTHSGKLVQRGTSRRTTHRIRNCGDTPWTAMETRAGATSRWPLGRTVCGRYPSVAAASRSAGQVLRSPARGAMCARTSCSGHGLDDIIPNRLAPQSAWVQRISIQVFGQHGMVWRPVLGRSASTWVSSYRRHCGKA